MRLLNIYTLAFKEFFDRDVPPYGILSHRWTDDEIAYKDFIKGRNKHSKGYAKVMAFCEFVRTGIKLQADTIYVQSPDGATKDFVDMATREGLSLSWVWVDSICIDKRSSQELSEAINSMFAWYARAAVCIVYMHDVPAFSSTVKEFFQQAFESSDWFTRGWTLQELLAPALSIFCDQTWEVFGHVEAAHGSTRRLLQAPGSIPPGDDLTDWVAMVTGIDHKILDDRSGIFRSCTALRMSWAAKRTTTRVEDEAYCLLGLLDVNMPLLYGEGHKAFQRLQEELIKRSDDQSILAWHGDKPTDNMIGILASNVRAFRYCGNLSNSIEQLPSDPFAITNVGLHIPAGQRLWKLDCESLEPTFDKCCAIYVMNLTCREDADNWRVLLATDTHVHQADNHQATCVPRIDAMQSSRWRGPIRSIAPE
jgi:hypothetical protein